MIREASLLMANITVHSKLSDNYWKFKVIFVTV